MNSPIQYTSRTFNTILADINSDKNLVDKPDWFKKIWAGVGDVLSVIENATANGNFLRTAFTRRQVQDLCNLIGYQPLNPTTASGTVLLDLIPTVSFPLSLSAAQQACVAGSQSSSARRYEPRASAYFTSSTEVVASGSWSSPSITVANLYVTGEKVRLTSSGTLPTGLSAGTDYYAIYISGTSIKLATSRANSYAGTNLTWSSAGSGNHTITRLSRSVTMYQQTTIAQSVIGNSDGVSENQQFPLSIDNVLPDTLVITINSVTWTKVDTFIDSGASSTHYRLLYNTDGSSYVEFGDGVYGAIPGSFAIYAAFAVGGWAVSNVGIADTVSSYIGGSSSITGCSNPSTLTGGADAESLDHAKRIAPLLLRSRDRFVTVEDGQALVLNGGFGVSQVSIIANGYGLLTAEVLVVMTGGGAPDAPTKAAIGTYSNLGLSLIP